MTDTTDKQASGALRQAMNRSAAVARLSIQHRKANNYLSTASRIVGQKVKAMRTGSTKGLTP